jgi:hypothetical protein
LYNSEQNLAASVIFFTKQPYFCADINKPCLMISERVNTLKKHIQTALFIGLVIGTSACHLDANSIEQEDPNAGSEYVYGNIGGPPKQAGNQYEADPDATTRAAAIREKMFGDTQGAEAGSQQGNAGQ